MRLAFGTETKRPPSLESRHADAFAKSSASLLRARRHQPPESNFIAAFGREGVRDPAKAQGYATHLVSCARARCDVAAGTTSDVQRNGMGAWLPAERIKFHRLIWPFPA